jgi:hypothetical protein
MPAVVPFIPLIAAAVSALPALTGGGGKSSTPAAPQAAPAPAPPAPPAPEATIAPEPVLDEDAARIRSIKRRQAEQSTPPTALEDTKVSTKTLLGE